MPNLKSELILKATNDVETYKKFLSERCWSTWSIFLNPLGLGLHSIKVNTLNNLKNAIRLQDISQIRIIYSDCIDRMDLEHYSSNDKFYEIFSSTKKWIDEHEKGLDQLAESNSHPNSFHA